MKVAYYPGCALHSSAVEYDLSTQAVARALGIELEEISDWACCGASAAHQSLHSLSLSLPVANLIKAHQMGSDHLITCCAACFSRLRVANDVMRHDAVNRQAVEKITGEPYRGEVEVKHFLDLLTNVYGLKKLKEKIQKKMPGLRVACYYGCLLTRPKNVSCFDDMENPHLMDDLMKVLGIEPVEWPYKTECCGASFSITKAEVVLKLSGDILQMAADEGAEAIVVACPLCQSNLDLRQEQINQKYKKKFNIPILYFTQLVGLGLGIGAEKLGFEKHMVDPFPLLQKKSLVPVSS